MSPESRAAWGFDSQTYGQTTMRRLSLARVVVEDVSKLRTPVYVIHAAVEVIPGDSPDPEEIRAALVALLVERWEFEVDEPGSENPGEGRFEGHGPDRIAHALALALRSRYTGDRYISVSVDENECLGAAVVFDPALRLGDRA